MRNTACLGLAALALACGEEGRFIARRWTYTSERRAAPPGLGAEGRVLVLESENPARLVTVNEQDGARVEGPFDAFPSVHAPLGLGARLYFVSSVGRVVALDFAGQTVFSAPSAPVGLSGPLAVAPDGSLRLATTSGRLLGLAAADGVSLFDVALPGAAPSPLAFSADGRTYVATDTGKLIGVDSSGAQVFAADLHAPASGPSVGADGAVVVGELDGVRGFRPDGSELFSRPRGARVVGTRALSGGGFAAWGEDGAVEILDAAGAVTGRFEAGPPIYAHVTETRDGELGVIDSSGLAYAIDRSGERIAVLDLDTAPLAEITTGPLGFALIAQGNSVIALDFGAR